VSDRGVFIDLDGTLADSLATLRDVYRAFLRNYGVQGTEAEFQSLDGPPLLQIVTSLRALHDLRGKIEDLTAEYAAMIRKAHRTTPPMVGAQLFLERARERRWRVAVVTSSSHSVARAWLERNRVSDQVDAVVGGDEVVHGKPAADPYKLAITRINCTASRSIAVEDSRIGARSAVSAGLSTWVLGRPDDRSDWPVGVRFVERFTGLLEML
jgi:beta-phosphoglucomutase-like phosphatase (HAD superfamily)